MGNSATAPGNQQSPQTKSMHKCGECGTYTSLCNSGRATDSGGKKYWERDHVPSKAALLKAAESVDRRVRSNKDLRKCVKDKVTARGFAIVIPRKSHVGHSRTHGRARNTDAQIKEDAGDLKSAARKDTLKMQQHLNGTDCEDAYREAAKEARAHDSKKMVREAVKECKESLGI